MNPRLLAALLGLAVTVTDPADARAVDPDGKEPKPVLLTRQPKPLGVTAVSTTRGVLIRGVVRGSPAEKAGLEPGDLITRVDGFEVGVIGGVEFPLQSELRRARGAVTLDVIDSRTRKPMTIEVQLEEAGPPPVIADPGP